MTKPECGDLESIIQVLMEMIHFPKEGTIDRAYEKEPGRGRAINPT
jgi:hypothetical protein